MITSQHQLPFQIAAPSVRWHLCLECSDRSAIWQACLGSTAAEASAIFQSDINIRPNNLATSRLQSRDLTINVNQWILIETLASLCSETSCAPPHRASHHYNNAIMSCNSERLKSPASRLFTQSFIQTQNKKKHQSSAPLAFVRGIHRWIPHTNGQLRGKCLMTSSWYQECRPLVTWGDKHFVFVFYSGVREISLTMWFVKNVFVSRPVNSLRSGYWRYVA